MFLLLHNHANDFLKALRYWSISLLGVDTRPINIHSSLFVLGEIWT